MSKSNSNEKQTQDIGKGRRGRSTWRGQSNTNLSSLKRFETTNKSKMSDYVYKIASGGKKEGKFTQIKLYLLTYMQQTYDYGGDIKKAL